MTSHENQELFHQWLTPLPKQNLRTVSTCSCLHVCTLMYAALLTCKPGHLRNVRVLCACLCKSNTALKHACTSIGGIQIRNTESPGSNCTSIELSPIDWGSSLSGSTHPSMSSSVYKKTRNYGLYMCTHLSYVSIFKNNYNGSVA